MSGRSGSSPPAPPPREPALNDGVAQQVGWLASNSVTSGVTGRLEAATSATRVHQDDIFFCAICGASMRGSVEPCGLVRAAALFADASELLCQCSWRRVGSANG